MQNNTFTATADTLLSSHLQEKRLREKLEKIRQRLMRKIRDSKAKTTKEKSISKHAAAIRDLAIMAEIHKSIDALKQNIKQTK